ncbi:MAG: PIN domain-containing protein [Myxococcaceae bacterium]
MNLKRALVQQQRRRYVEHVLHVVLETNALVSDPGLKGGPFQLLEEEGDQLGIQLYVPLAVLEEFKAHARREFDEQIVKPFRRLNDARDRWAPALSLPSLDAAANSKAFEARLVERMLALRVLTLPLPSVSQQQTLERAVTKRAPFSPNGAGYVDALIWFTVVELLDREEGGVLLIGADSDFRKEGEFSPELLAELSPGAAARFESYRTLGEFVTKHVEATPETLSQVQRVFTLQPLPPYERPLAAELREQLLSELIGRTFDGRGTITVGPSPVTIAADAAQVTAMRLDKALRLPHSDRVLVFGTADLKVRLPPPVRLDASMAPPAPYPFWFGGRLEYFDVRFQALLQQPMTTAEHLGSAEVVSVTARDGE